MTIGWYIKAGLGPLSESIMEVIKNNKDSLKLCYEGYLYTKKIKTRNIIWWEWSNRALLSCKGAVSTNHDVTVPLCYKEHSHNPNPAHVAAAKLHQQIKSDAWMKKPTPPRSLLRPCQEPLMKFVSELGSQKPDAMMLDGWNVVFGQKSQPLLQSWSLSLLESTWTTTGGNDPKQGFCPFFI